MARDFIPARDGDFNNWATAFATRVNKDPTEYGLSAEDAAEMQAAIDNWKENFKALFQKRDAARAATVAKDESRKLLESTLRNISRQIQADPKITVELKAGAGLPVYSTSKSPTTTPDSAPVAVIDAGTIQQHSIRFIDSHNTFRRSRPRGVFGIEIHRYVGDSRPLNEEQFVYIETVTRMQATISFTDQQAGQSAFYRFRYMNMVGETGPWSKNYRATIMN